MENKDNGDFQINVYSPGNFIAKEIHISGDVNISSDSKSAKQNGYTDEQIARAIEAICGEGKPLHEKKMWAAVYWCLRWYCNFPVKGTDFCERIAKLPFTKVLEPACDYNNIRRLILLSFMNMDCHDLNSVKPSKSDELFFAECRVVLLALLEELGKAVLPKL